MSIVDNLSNYRIFPVFFLFLVFSSRAEPLWQTQIGQDLCSQWHNIAASAGECELSFPSLSGQYQLPSCDKDWSSKLLRPLKPGRNGLEFSCDSPKWQQNFAVHLHVYKEVAVLARAVSIGQQLTAADISFSRYDTSTISKDFFTSAEQIIGQQIKRNLKAGTLLGSDMLDAPLLIERGDLLLIQTKRPGLKVKMQGVAMERGKLGQVIRVRNSQSNNIVAARVLAAGIVQVE